jgi:tetratricopeptide (TPR) repeat protein/SAM-dependent methyltransferase
MNRAEKRRQRKLAEKAAKREARKKPGGGQLERQQQSTIEQDLDLAIQHHKAGDLRKAEGIYQQILEADPNQPVALHLLGVIAHQVGKNDLAVDLITKVTAIKPDYAEAHINLGNVLKDLGKLDDAVASYHKALAIKPDYAEAHNNLGNALRELGKLDDATASYHKALAIKPDYADAHNNLGVALQNLGRPEEAVASYHKALAIKPDYADAHNNLGNAFKELGGLEDAVASYHKALAIKPDYAEAHSNLGFALQNLGKPDEAVASCHKALAIKPDLVEAHNNLGNALQDLGRPEEAVASYQKALAIKPDLAEAHNNLGNSLKELGQLDEAVASYHRALAIKPDYAEAHSNLGLALYGLGKSEDAFTCQRRAIVLNPQNDVFWAGLASSLETLSFTSVDDNLWQDLLHLLELPRVRPSHLIRPIISALRHHPDFSRIFEVTGFGKAEIGIAYGDMAEQLSAVPLFLRIMGLSPINDLKVERMLTVLRRSMLEETVAGKIDEKSLPFSAALALQCFTNEYVFPETDEEKAAVESLQQQIATLVEEKREVPPSFVVTLGAYRPLFSFPWARELGEREWAGNIKEVIERQISEPLEELSLRARIPCLTSIQNTVSQTVREQYEENPYPRWIKTGIGGKGRAIGAVLQGAPLRLDLGDYQSPERPEILVAGCGTGRHAVNTASRFSNARVIAVDLSLSSLSYALRKTNELGFSNIEYAQADIIELGSLERRFDLIECVGVLHHLGDPLAGWQVLVDLLRPGGLMKLGLYSEVTRQDIISGHHLIAEKGYTTSPEDIRRCRQDIITKAEDGNRKMAEICRKRDFFSLSECRDLLFHVQEHRFTLPQVQAALQALKLKFLGFEIRDQRVLRKFRKSHPSKDALTSLPLWHKFELKNPDTFRSMYQFWCKKM